MKTTVIPAIKNALFYIPFIGGGAVLTKQLSKIPGVYETAVSLEQKVLDGLEAMPGISEGLANFTVDSSEFLLGASIAVASAFGLKKLRKKKDFKTIIDESEPKEKIDEEKSSLARRSGRVVGKSLVKISAATASGTTLLASGLAAPPLYDFFAGKYSEMTSGGLESPWVKSALGIAAILGSSKLFSSMTHKKHGPIMKRYYVDGYFPPTRALHPKRLGVKRIGGFEPSSLRGMHSETVPCARIISTDYAADKKRRKSRTMWMAYRKDLEPKGVKKKLNSANVDDVLKYLKDYASRSSQSDEVKISPSEVFNLAKESDIYAAAEQGVFKTGKLQKFDIGRIVRGLSDIHGGDVLSANLENMVSKLNKEKLWNVGGYFQLSVNDGKPSSVRLILRESILHSDSISKDRKGGYGENYVKKGKMLMVLPYRTYESGKTEDGGFIEGGMEDSGEMSSNVIRQDKKGWNQVLRLGFGKNYLIYFGDTTYTYDEWWVGSGKFITDLMPGLRGKEYAPRRIGYVYNPNWKIVAKISDVTSKVPTKLIGNYDRIIDVYDPNLAKNENFGALLCGFSRFLTHQRKYRDNRIQEVLPDGTLLTGTGDIDLAGQV